MIEIVEYSDKNRVNLEILIYKLCLYIVKIDPLKMNGIKKDFKQVYIDYLLEDVAEKNGKIYMAIFKNKIVGVIVGIIKEHDKVVKSFYLGKKEGLIHELYVEEKYRGLKLASKLMSKMEEHFKLNGCDEIRLNVFAQNNLARKFYNKLEYSERNINLMKKI
ncbi:MAG: GNAT family N-acetyltransferase [Clostridia bacterium]|nr:GNAT family N-acetyltransferase [Clostridia bacterium]